MRIAFVAPFGMQPKGTVSARIMPLAHALARRGHMVRVVIPPWDDPSAQAGGNVAALISTEGGRGGIKPLRGNASADTRPYAGVHVVTLPLPKRVPAGIALTYGLVKEALRPSAHTATPFESREHRKAMRTLTTFRPEVVHVFKPVGYSGLAGLALAALRVPWVLDVDDWEGPGGWADTNPYSAAQKLAATLQEALLPRMAGAVTASSRTLEARAWSFGLPRRKVFYLPNGVSQDKYGAWLDPPDPVKMDSLRKWFGLEGHPVILLYTRFAEFAYSWPLDVLAGVREHHPYAKLLVVGNCFFGEEEKLLAEAERLGIGGSVAVAGRVAEAELPTYLSLGDVALYPMEDNLINRAKSPVKVLEPMVMGLPLVAHAVGQAAEFVGDAGVLVPAGDLRGMAEAVSALLSDPERRRRLGERTQERVWSRFNWEGLSVAAERAYGVALRRWPGG